METGYYRYIYGSFIKCPVFWIVYTLAFLLTSTIVAMNISYPWCVNLKYPHLTLLLPLQHSRRRSDSSSSSSSSDSSSSDDEERESRRSKSRSKRTKKEKKHRSRTKLSSSNDEEAGGPVPLSRFFSNMKS